MSKNFVTITGATGHIGSRAIEILVQKGIGVRAVARTTAKLNALKGAEAFAADVTDSAALQKAFTGARAAFVMIPPNVTAADVRADQNRVADCLVKALQASKVSHVVALSSVGAHQGTKMGPVNGLYDWEQKLRKLSGVNVQILRPCYFMENLLVNVGLIKANGIMGSALRADLRMPMIATRDIATVVAQSLETPNFSGVTVRELLGERDITMEEARAAIAKAIGKPELKYIQFAYADAEKAMVGMGLSRDYAAQLIEMSRSMNEGIARPTQARGAETTTPTSIEVFAASVFAAAFKAPAPASR